MPQYRALAVVNGAVGVPPVRAAADPFGRERLVRPDEVCPVVSAPAQIQRGARAGAAGAGESVTPVIENHDRRPTGSVNGPLWIPEEAAAFLRVPRSHVMELARRNLLPTVHVGRFVRFREQDLLAWAAKGGASPSERTR